MSELNPALAAFHAGRLDEARRLLTRLLQKSTGNLEALYLLAVTEQSLNHHGPALDLYDKVLLGNPGHGWAHYNKALLLSGKGQHREALAHHDQAVLLTPANFWAYINRGNTKAALKRFQNAIADFDQALVLAPGQPDALANKGNALAEQGQLSAALICQDEAIQRHPQHAPSWISRAQTLSKLGRHEDAVRDAEQALQLQPRHPEAWVRKGAARVEIGQATEGLADIEQALAIHPEYVKAWSAHGDALLKLERYDEALSSYDKSLALDPHLVHGHANKGVVLQYLGHDDLAKPCFEHAIELEPDHVDANKNLAFLLLSQHDYARGWEKNEHRWRKTNPPPKQLNSSKPLWSGEPRAEPVLLWGEQGIGDQLLYGSILPELSGLSPRKQVALDKRLIPLFERSLPGNQYIDLDQASDALGFAAQLPLGSLPRLFRSSAASFSAARRPYLVADTLRTSGLRNKIARAGKRICGVSWSSSRQDIGTQKSISLEQMLLPLASDTLEFVNLQYGDTRTEREALQQRHGIKVQNVDEVDNFKDIDGLAALIQACDIVITTSNSTAHLAGALGKETLLLLAAGKGMIWYWTEYAGQNLWYPSIRIFAQDQPGQWQQALAQVRLHLESKSWN